MKNMSMEHFSCRVQPVKTTSCDYYTSSYSNEFVIKLLGSSDDTMEKRKKSLEKLNESIAILQNYKKILEKVIDADENFNDKYYKDQSCSTFNEFLDKRKTEEETLCVYNSSSSHSNSKKQKNTDNEEVTVVAEPKMSVKVVAGSKKLPIFAKRSL